MGEQAVDTHVEELKKEKKRKSEATDVKKAKKSKENVSVSEGNDANNESVDASKPVKKKKFFRDKPEKVAATESETKKKKSEKGAEKKEQKEDAEKKDKLKRRSEKKENKENAEKAKKKGKVKSKFSISLSVGDPTAAGPVPPAAGQGRGPRIVIAKEESKPTDKKSKRKTKKRRKEEGGLSTGAESGAQELKGREKALSYLRVWAGDRDAWKFEKCRQIWLVQHAFHPSHVPEEDFPALLRYLASVRGGMREAVLRSARAKVATYVSWEERVDGRGEEAVIAGAGEERVSEAESDRALLIMEELKS